VAIRFGPLPDSTLTARKLGESGRVIVPRPDIWRAMAPRPAPKTSTGTIA
jgi:hypothetical protein